MDSNFLVLSLIPEAGHGTGSHPAQSAPRGSSPGDATVSCPTRERGTGTSNGFKSVPLSPVPRDVCPHGVAVVTSAWHRGRGAPAACPRCLELGARRVHSSLLRSRRPPAPSCTAASAPSPGLWGRAMSLSAGARSRGQHGSVPTSLPRQPAVTDPGRGQERVDVGRLWQGRGLRGLFPAHAPPLPGDSWLRAPYAGGDELYPPPASSGCSPGSGWSRDAGVWHRIPPPLLSLPAAPWGGSRPG